MPRVTRANGRISHFRSTIEQQAASKRAADSCPLWVKSRHRSRFGQCPLYPQKQTLVERVGCLLCAKSGHSIATRLYKAECVVRARRRWHLRQITDEIEPSERGRHVLGARRNSERETRKPRCAKPSAPKRSRRRMKPILH